MSIKKDHIIRERSSFLIYAASFILQISDHINLLSMRCHAIYSLKLQWAIKTKVSLMILLSFASSASSVIFPWFLPRLRCAIAARRMNFDLEAFDRYNEFFNDESVMELAQTGVYKGAQGIEEYIQFAFPKTSPFFGDIDINTPAGAVPQVTNLGIDATSGLCVFIGVAQATNILEPGTATALPQTSAIGMLRMYVDIRKRVVTRLNLYYPADFMRVLFGVGLESANTRKFICQQMIEGSCKDILSNTNNTVDCESRLATLPATDGPLSRVDGNTQGCRALHGVLSQFNPKMHCAHLSFEPLQDPLGRIKCQAIGSTVPSDLFTDNDFKMYNKYAIENGIDPTIGHNCTAC